MRGIGTFLSLSWADRRLLLDAFAVLVWVRLALRFSNMDRLRAWAGLLGPPGRPVGKVVWAVCAIGGRLPGTRCLSMAFATQRLLACNGHPSEVHIGVARSASGMAAHAWVVREGRVVIDSEDHGTYTQLVAWPAGSGGDKV